MKLIVGLGNPGQQYRDTRHNAGFMVVDELARRHGLNWAMAPAQVPDAFVAKQFGAVAVMLAKPLTFMNRSGDGVAALVRYYDVAPGDLLVVVDDIDLPFGRLRARAAGSAGTHNGLRSVVEHMGLRSSARLRLGVGRGDARRELADHVLSKFEPARTRELESVITRAADAAEMFAAEGIITVMNTYNPDDAASATRMTPCLPAGCRVRLSGPQSARITSRRRRMNRKYELVYVVSPEATDEQVTELHTQVEAIVQRMGGTLEKTENWGRRKLAYEIGRHKEGTYVLEVIMGAGELMKEIDRRLKVSDLDHPPPGRSAWTRSRA